MRYIEPHGHMVSRTTDDYLSMVTADVKRSVNPPSGRASTENPLTVFTIISANSPSMNRVVRPSLGSLTTAGYASIPRNRKIFILPRKSWS